jgi:methanogenic corrinoid protein MtbC1
MPTHSAAEQIKQLLNTIILGDKTGADTILETWAQLHGYRSAIETILEPALEEIGVSWDKEQISLAAGYLAGKVAEDVLNKANLSEVVSVKYKGTAIIGNIEDDYHALGRKMVGIFLRTSGWNVIDLGNDVIPAMFVDAAVENGAQIIGVSAMMYTTALNIKGVRKEIALRNLSGNMKLAVGGAIFKIRPDLVDEVGGDGTTANAVGAPALFDRLKEELL